MPLTYIVVPPRAHAARADPTTSRSACGGYTSQTSEVDTTLVPAENAVELGERQRPAGSRLARCRRTQSACSAATSASTSSVATTPVVSASPAELGRVSTRPSPGPVRVHADELEVGPLDDRPQGSGRPTLPVEN